MMMNGFSVLLLALCCGLLEAQTIEKDQGRLTSVTQEERLAVLERRLEASEKEVSHLKNLSAVNPAIAFSVALVDEIQGSFGPFPQRTIIPYQKVFANTGNGYNPRTGTFTAVVRGMYFFRFTMFSTSAPDSVACIWKNNEILVCLWEVKEYPANDTGSNAVIIPLLQGDRVNVKLEANRKLLDNRNHFNTFSGFLLFQL